MRVADPEAVSIQEGVANLPQLFLDAARDSEKDCKLSLRGILPSDGK